MDIYQESLIAHKTHRGKIGINTSMPITNQHELSIAYSPGVGEVSRQIFKNPELAKYTTIAGRCVAVISNGSAVLGLGNIGASASLPVMEGKCALLKEFANIDAFPIVINSSDPDEIINIITKIAPTFAGINLEDIKAPECFYIEETLKQTLNIPVFHDDQHGTAIVVLAGLINASKVVNKDLDELKIVINGAGAAGIAIGHLLHQFGVGSITLIDSKGVITSQSASNEYKKQIALFDNYDDAGDNLAVAIAGKDVFIGVSQPNILSPDMINDMNDQAIVFALANPDPEISLAEAQKSNIAVLATGRSDYPNQVNNVLAFPGIFKGLIASGATRVTDQNKIDAAIALAGMVDKPTKDKILPNPFEPEIADLIANSIS